jgi:UDP-N-acetylglucosamine pyrophosphorylase
LIDFQQIRQNSAALVKKILDVIKLNGGLGTSMGLSKAKSQNHEKQSELSGYYRLRF